MKDLFAKERNQAFDEKRKQAQLLKTLSEFIASSLRTAIDKEVIPYVNSIRPKDAITPVKGTDYFTEAEVEAIKRDILALIPTPKDGVTPEVDYNQIFSYVEQKIKQLPKPKDGKSAPAPVIDYAKIISGVIESLPLQVAPIPQTHDLKAVQEYIDKRLKWLATQERRVVGYSSLSQLTDVRLDGVSQDAQGNYLLAASSFEKVSKNLAAYPNVLNYTADVLTSIVYTTDLGTVTKSLNYTGETLTSVVLSGALPSDLLATTKTLTYSGSNLIGISYS